MTAPQVLAPKPKHPPKISKVQHWPEVMNDIIMASMHKKFVWGEHDCCTWVFDHMKAVTGHDPIAKHRGKYKSALAAKRMIKRNYGTLEKGMVALAKNLHLVEVHPFRAQRLNICLMDLPGQGPALGICVGATAAFVSELGLRFFPMSQVRRAWHF